MSSSCGHQQIKMMNMEDYLAMQTKKSIMINKQYVNSLKKALKELKKLLDEENKDRMDYALILISIITLMNNSCQGWARWCNIVKLNEIFKSKEEFAEVTNKMLKLMEQWIKFDIAVTGKQVKTMESEITKKPSKKSKKSKRKKSTYVA